jgi:tetratricopeptide (TPR) repeat protein
MKYQILSTTVLLNLMMVGCAKNGPQSARQSPTAFDRVKEPSINANTYFAAGQLAESRQDSARAEAEYRKALKDNPNHQNALYRLGCLYAQDGKLPQSIEIWQRYVKVSNGSADAYSDLAYAEELAGNPNGAEADYRRGIAKDPKNEACRVNYGLMLARHNRMNEGVLQLQTVLTPAEVHYNLAGVYEIANRRELAKAEYQQALELDPNLTEAKTKLAQLELGM